MLHWTYLSGTAFCALVALGAYFVRRAEKQSGRALLGWQRLCWNAEQHPVRFRIRLESYWLFIGIFGAAALAFLAEFLGIVA